MPSPITNDIIKKVNKLYLKSGYMDKYGSDVWTSVILCIIFFSLISYFLFFNTLEVIRSDWDNQKCSPLIIPFAGLINKPHGYSTSEYTVENFTHCINTSLKFISEMALQPFIFMVSVIDETIKGIIKSIDKLREVINYMRQQFSIITDSVNAGLNNLIVSFIGFVVKIKDSIGKVNGILTTSLYTLLGSYMAMESLFLIIIDMIILILIIIAVMIVVFWLVALSQFFIPIFGSALAAPWIVSAVIATLIMVAIMIPVIYIKIMMDRIMDMSTPDTPGVPRCFSENTIIQLLNGKEKLIKDIEVGDVLSKGEKVTGYLKLSASDQHIYKLNGVVVTGEHRVFHPLLKWIKVKDHPLSQRVPDFNEPFVYCLNTDTKSFTIGETLFSDWDDIDEKVLHDLHKNCLILPEHFTNADIHTHLDSGFHPDTILIMDNGLTLPIKAVEVNQILASGDKVLGIVKIAGHDIEGHISLPLYLLSGSKNIHTDEPVLGGFISHNNEPLLYHLLTDTGFFVINQIRINDYNYAIDKYIK